MPGFLTRCVAALLDDAEHDVLAYMDYPEPHSSKGLGQFRRQIAATAV